MAAPVLPLSFRALHESALVRVREYRCRAARGGPAGEEHSERSSIVFLRHGAFRKHFGARSVTADVNQAVFFSRGTSYRVSHPGGCGDRGTVIEPAPNVLADIRRELEPELDEGAERPFPFVTGPCAPELVWRHHGFVRRLEGAAREPLEPLWADVTALQLAADTLAAAHARHGLARAPRRAGTDDDHAERAEAARAYLASRVGERVTLEDVARAVHASPFHFARLFQRHTGVPVHRYLLRLRLGVALERLLGGADDLTALALDLGFSSHSHFTASFRREFGRTPSSVRRASGRERARLR